VRDVTCSSIDASVNRARLLKWRVGGCQLSRRITKGAITSKVKHAIKHKTRPARLAQLLQPSLAFCFSLQPMTRRIPSSRNSCAGLAGLVLCFIACFILLVIAP